MSPILKISNIFFVAFRVFFQGKRKSGKTRQHASNRLLDRLQTCKGHSQWPTVMWAVNWPTLYDDGNNAQPRYELAQERTSWSCFNSGLLLWSRATMDEVWNESLEAVRRISPSATFGHQWFFATPTIKPSQIAVILPYIPRRLLFPTDEEPSTCTTFCHTRNHLFLTSWFSSLVTALIRK